MVAAMVCDKRQWERELICRDCVEQIAKKSDEQFSFENTQSRDALLEAIEQEKPVDLLYYEFDPGQSVEELSKFRSRYKASMVMLITDPTVSPLEYLRPGAAPDSLMLRPLDAETLNRQNGEFIGTFLDRFQRMESEECFVINTREEKLYIPYPHIFYFEARDKKLFARTKNNEYAFYGTIELLSKTLPETFVRCHRSFIVNKQKMVRIISAENYIELYGKIGVPMSRTFKPVLMEKRV